MPDVAHRLMQSGSTRASSRCCTVALGGPATSRSLSVPACRLAIDRHGAVGPVLGHGEAEAGRHRRLADPALSEVVVMTYGARSGSSSRVTLRSKSPRSAAPRLSRIVARPGGRCPPDALRGPASSAASCAAAGSRAARSSRSLCGASARAKGAAPASRQGLRRRRSPGRPGAERDRFRLGVGLGLDRPMQPGRRAPPAGARLEHHRRRGMRRRCTSAGVGAVRGSVGQGHRGETGLGAGAGAGEGAGAAERSGMARCRLGGWLVGRWHPCLGRGPARPNRASSQPSLGSSAWCRCWYRCSRRCLLSDARGVDGEELPLAVRVIGTSRRVAYASCPRHPAAAGGGAVAVTLPGMAGSGAGELGIAGCAGVARVGGDSHAHLKPRLDRRPGG